MSSTSASREGQDAKTLLKTPRSEASMHESLRVLRFWQLLKECEVLSTYPCSESDVRRGYVNEFGGNSIHPPWYMCPGWCLSVRCFVCFTRVSD